MTMKFGKKGAHFTTYDFGVTGCSSALSECIPHTNGEATLLKSIKLKLMSLSQANGNDRLTGLLYTRMPNLETSGSVRTTKEEREKYIFYKLLRGNNKDTVGMFCHPRAGTITLNKWTDLVQHMPWWVLRPWELFNTKAMIEQGLVRVKTGKAKKRPNSWQVDNPTKRFPAKYGHNGKHLPTSLKTAKLEWKRYKGYWGGNPQYVERISATVAVAAAYTGSPLHGVKGSTRHVSQDMGELFGKTPWWAGWTMLGYKNIEAQAVLQEISKGAIERFKAGRDIIMIGGNWNCGTATDSIRPLMVLAEKLAKKKQDPCSDKPAWFMHNGKRIYFAILPYIYESPQHRHHPVNCAFLSDEPLYIKQVWKR